MAYRSFCDKCDSACKNTTTRRWEHITGDLGLEVVILKGEISTGEVHICEDCILAMLWEIFDRSKYNKLKENITKLQHLERLKITLEGKEQRLIKLETELKAQKIFIDDMELKIKDSESLLVERETLAEQMAVIKSREPEVIRQAEARGYQRAIDEKSNKDYVAAVSVREDRRRLNR
jgi:hypothetical protein